MTLRVALGEYDTGWHDPAASLSLAADLIRRAKSSGADLVVLPEMCTTGFTMEPEAQAEPLDGPSVTRFSSLARESNIHLVAGIATRADGRFYNSSILFTPDGSIAAEYRKRRLFAFAQEDRSYSAGEEPVVADVNGVKLGLFICFELRFPELFRDLAPRVDAFVIVANWPVTRQSHWETLLRARAIENQSYVVAVNRTGVAGGAQYAGGSFVIEPWGETIARGALEIGDVNPEVVTRARRGFPLIADRRGE